MTNNGVHATFFFFKCSALVANLSIPHVPFNIPFLLVHLLGVHELPLLGAEGIPSPSDLLLTTFYLLGCIYNGFKGWILPKL